MRVVALTFHDVVADHDGRGTASDPAIGPPAFGGGARPVVSGERGGGMSPHSGRGCRVPRAEPVGLHGFYRVRLSDLETLLSQLRKLGYQTVSSRQFRAWQLGRSALPERAVVLTFDDGHASHFELVAPLLIRYRFTGTFFVPTDWIGTPGHLTWDHLRKLVFLGMEIGTHGISHRPLTDLPAHELQAELARSKGLLEERLGIPVRALAAPGGCWNAAVAAAVRQAGYEAAWVSTIGTNGRETNPLGLRRTVVRQPFSAQRLVSMVEGWQPAFWWAANQQLLIRLLKRTLGVYRYEQLKRVLVPNA